MSRSKKPNFKAAHDKAYGGKTFVSDVTYLTVITDASHSPITGCCGWAGQAVLDGQRHQFSGGAVVASVQEAELLAVERVIAQMDAAGHLLPGLGWVLQVDNTHVVGCLNLRLQFGRSTPGMVKPHQYPSRSLFERETLERLAVLVNKHSPKFFYVKHVKAHVPHAHRAPRHHVHDIIDRLCGQARRAFEVERGHGPS